MNEEEDAIEKFRQTVRAQQREIAQQQSYALQQMQYQGSRYVGMEAIYGRSLWNDGSTVQSPVREETVLIPVKPKKPPKPKRSDEEVKTAFAALMTDSGFRKQLTVLEKVTHEMAMGLDLEEYKEQQKKRVEAEKAEEATKILCPICHDPQCPWST